MFVLLHFTDPLHPHLHCYACVHAARNYYILYILYIYILYVLYIYILYILVYLYTRGTLTPLFYVMSGKLASRLPGDPHFTLYTFSFTHYIDTQHKWYILYTSYTVIEYHIVLIIKFEEYGNEMIGGRWCFLGFVLHLIPIFCQRMHCHTTRVPLGHIH